MQQDWEKIPKNVDISLWDVIVQPLIHKIIIIIAFFQFLEHYAMFGKGKGEIIFGNIIYCELCCWCRLQTVARS